MFVRLLPITAIAAVLLIWGGEVLAESAHWYKWQGASRTVCAQNSPGPGWKRLGGPYVKADCSL